MATLTTAAAVALIDPDKRVLIAKRPEGKIMAGYWEFPGGKLHAGETPEAALKREVEEEIGITLGCFAPLGFISEAREAEHVLVLLYLCREWQGIPQPKEGQELAWVRPLKLKEYNILPGNIPLIPILRDQI